MHLLAEQHERRHGVDAEHYHQVEGEEGGADEEEHARREAEHLIRLHRY